MTGETWHEGVFVDGDFTYLAVCQCVDGEHPAGSEVPIDAIIANHAAAAQVQALREALERIDDRHHMMWPEYAKKYGLPSSGLDSPTCDEIATKALAALSATSSADEKE